jgi:hypothetical protein
MEDQIGLGAKGVDLVDGDLERSDDVLVSVFAESNVTVADLDERKWRSGNGQPGFVRNRAVSRDLGQVKGARHSSRQSEQEATACPRHTFQKPAPIDLVVRADTKNAFTQTNNLRAEFSVPEVLIRSGLFLFPSYP